MKNTTADIFYRPLFQLVGEASEIHRKYFPNNKVQASSLLSIKTGGCSENCSYCPQSAHYKTAIEKTKILDRNVVVAAAEMAKTNGASRFCMGAAWREITDGKDFDHVLGLVNAVSELGLEVCCTLGMLNAEQARRLKEAGLDYYNHNIDTSPDFYNKVIQTRSFQDRKDTLAHVREAGLSVCTGGILGLGEDEKERVLFIEELVSMRPQPESITVNMLVPIAGTPLENAVAIEPFELVRVIATLRLKAPQSMIRLSAGRSKLSDEAQFLCFLAGANSIFLGDKLLTSSNSTVSEDTALLKKLGLEL